MRTAVSLVSLLLVAGLAGCIGSSDDDLDAANVDVPTPAGLVDAVAALEQGAEEANLEVLGGFQEGLGQEADAWGDLLFVDQGGSVAILNVSDPKDIRKVSEVTGLPTVLDVKVSDDGQWLFIGDDAEGSTEATAGTGPFSGGIYVVDISDLEDPELVSFQQVGPRRGPHMVFHHTMADGTQLVLGANADISIHTFDPATGELTEESRYSPDLVTDFNREPHVFDVLYQGWAHDMFAMNEDDGRTLMYVANWDAGLRIVDITDPADPEELGGWNEFAQDEEGNLHTVATDWIGDRRITVGSAEVGFSVVGGTHYAQGTDLNVVWVWDTTDPEAIELLGRWINPLEAHSGRDQVPGEEITSPHNLQLEDGKVYLAHYGLGSWVLDVSTPENQSEPKVLAYHLDQGSVWDVVVNQGVMYTSGSQGILGLHYLPDVLGEDGITSRA